MSRRPSGEHTLYRQLTKSGDTVYVVQGMIPGLGRRKRHGRTEAEAWAAFEQLAKDSTRYDMQSGAPTLGDLATRWLENYELGKAETSTKGVKLQRVSKHLINDPIGKIRVDRLQPDDVERWLLRRIKDGYIRGGRRHAYAANFVRDLRLDLSQVIEWGIRRRVHGLDWNPANHIDRFKIDDAVEFKRSLTADQARDLIFAAATTGRRPYGTFVLTCLLLGCRPGEAAALRWERIDRNAATIRVDAALKRRNGAAIALGQTKTKTQRTVPVPQILLDALEVEHKRQREQARHPDWPQRWDGLVFLTHEGRPPTGNTLRKHLRAIIAEAGLPAAVADFDPYELRHTCATLLDRAGVEVQHITDQLGHADDRMFYRHYRHREDQVVSAKGKAAWEGLMTDG